MKLLNGKTRIPDAPGLRDRLEACASRYVLEPDVAEFSRELVLRQPDLLCSSLDFLRMPDEMIWVEWTEQEWQGQPAFHVGILIEADDAGRAGQLTLVTESKGNEPQISPAGFAFDLERLYPLQESSMGFSISHDSLALAPFFERVRGEINPVWANYWKGLPDPLSYAHEKRKLAQSLWMVPAVAFAFVLILGTNAQLDRERVGYERLNKQRLKRGKPKLLAHTEMRLRLFQPTGGDHGEAALVSRRMARLHHVRGHFVRRGDAIFWRKPHLRGKANAIQADLPMRRVSFG